MILMVIRQLLQLVTILIVPGWVYAPAKTQSLSALPRLPLLLGPACDIGHDLDMRPVASLKMISTGFVAIPERVPDLSDFYTIVNKSAVKQVLVELTHIQLSHVNQAQTMTAEAGEAFREDRLRVLR